MDLCDVDLAHIHEARDKPSAEATHLRAQKAELAPEPRAETAGWKGTTEGLVSEDFAGAEKARTDFEEKLKWPLEEDRVRKSPFHRRTPTFAGRRQFRHR